MTLPFAVQLRGNFGSLCCVIVVKIISWNIAGRSEAWRQLLDMDADLALLQEATPPPADIVDQIEADTAPWLTGGKGARRNWRAAIVRLSDAVSVDWLEPVPLGKAGAGQIAVSMPGTLGAAAVTDRESGKSVLAISAYGLWEKSNPMVSQSWIYADASVHRLISDISGLVGTQRHSNVIVSGDLNILHGQGEGGSRYWAGRYATIFERMEALGFQFAGPRAPNGRQADPWPRELPKDSLNVPTFRTNSRKPETATRQLDFVFVSKPLRSRVRVSAQNDPQDWGPSDHCRIEIEMDMNNWPCIEG